MCNFLGHPSHLEIPFLLKGTLVQFVKALTSDRLLKISHFSYLWFCSNLPAKSAISFKRSQRFNKFFYCLFLNKILRLNNLKTRTGMNAKISVFVICVGAIIYSWLYNLHHCTFRYFFMVLEAFDFMTFCNQ